MWNYKRFEKVYRYRFLDLSSLTCTVLPEHRNIGTLDLGTPFQKYLLVLFVKHPGPRTHPQNLDPSHCMGPCSTMSWSKWYTSIGCILGYWCVLDECGNKDWIDRTPPTKIGAMVMLIISINPCESWATVVSLCSAPLQPVPWFCNATCVFNKEVIIPAPPSTMIFKIWCCWHICEMPFVMMILLLLFFSFKIFRLTMPTIIFSRPAFCCLAERVENSWYQLSLDHLSIYVLTAIN